MKKTSRPSVKKHSHNRKDTPSKYTHIFNLYRQNMHSHHHHSTTAGNHRLPPQMQFQPLSSSPTTTINNPNYLQYLHPYDHDESLTTDSPPPARSLSSSASINHKEAEKRRRERINSHLNSLRSLLPCNAKTDKASLLAKVVQRLKELKQITSEIRRHESIPSETDEITVITLNNYNQDDEKIVIKASMCCENRSNLLAEMIGTLNSLKLSVLKVEMVAVGGRIRNVVVVECDWRRDDDCGELIECLREALSCLVTSDLGLNQSSKRRRMMAACR